MKILRLTNSNDVLESIPAHLRAAAIADDVVHSLTGERPETISRVIWPGPELPAIVARWIERYEPDLVFMRASSFWVCYESVPLHLQRHFGPVGRALGALGLKAGGNPTIATNPVAARLREYAVRTIGGDTHFTPAEAAGHVEDILRVVLKAESVVPVLRGPAHSHNSAGNASGLARSQRRVEEFEERLAALCRTLHVSFTSARILADEAATHLADGLHDDLVGQRDFGELEGRAIATAWLAAVGVH